MHIYRADIPRKICSPDIPQQSFSAVHLARVSYQEFQQLKVLAREIDLFASDIKTIVVAVELQISALNYISFVSLCAVLIGFYLLPY